MKTILDFLDWFVPRFFTEDVALKDEGDYYEIVCSMKDIEPGEWYDGVVALNAFNFFGNAYFVKQVGEVRPWPSKV